MSKKKFAALPACLLLPAMAVPAAAAAEMPSRLPVTGMVWWVLPALFAGGILLAVIGWRRHRGEEKRDGTDQS